MGKYSNLLDEEKDVILKLADAFADENTYHWMLSAPGPGESKLYALNGTSDDLFPMPGAMPLYQGLSGKGFIAISWGDSANLELCTQQLALDYRGYERKARLGRLYENLRSDLERQAVWVKVACVILGYVLHLLSDTLSTILLRLLD